MGDEPGFNVDSFMIFDGDRRQAYYAPNPECIFGWTNQLPYISSDTARIMIRVGGLANQEKIFVSPEFTIRPDPRLGLQPPSVQLLAPLGGTFSGGSPVNIAWSASASEGLRAFDIVCSSDGGQSWQPIVTELPASATSYQWRLPPSPSGIANLRLRVIASDNRFQTSATPAANAIVVTAGTQPGDVNGDGIVNVTDLLAVVSSWGVCPPLPATCPADLDHDVVVSVNDLLTVITNWS
jgi:hypothetical protein